MGTLATGLVIGLVLGAGLAILYAPQAGFDTRRKLRRGARRAQTRGLDAWDDLRFELRKARRQVQRFRRRGQLAAADTIDPD